ncbi:TauD/TfdA family dioxygenase [Immundisolibacter sp.]|uniref:TauD/TfdA family dioxygenase n=1 Tax=Immundisolibacter sp. TaxID=1934948 RepID=UPI003567EAD7
MSLKDPHPVTGPCVWCGTDYRDARHWVYQLSGDALADIDRAVHRVRDAGLNLEDVTPAQFDLPALADDLGTMAEILHRGRGFVRLQGIDRARYSDDELGIILWGLGSHLGIVVSQSQRGDRLGHVQDRGEIGRYYGIGGPIEVHMDPVDVTGLMCLTPARHGGATPLMSSFAVHNAILAERPDLLPALYRGFHYGSETVIKSDQPPITEHRIPVFNFVDGEPDCFFLPAAIRGPKGEPRDRMPAMEQEAIAYLQAVAERPDMKIDMVIDPATVQFVNNRVILHARADYQDWPQPERKRHLLRMWLMMPDWPKRPPEVQMLRSTDRAGGGIAKATA